MHKERQEIIKADYKPGMKRLPLLGKKKTGCCGAPTKNSQVVDLMGIGEKKK